MVGADAGRANPLLRQVRAPSHRAGALPRARPSRLPARRAPSRWFQLRRTLTGLVNAGLIEGYLLPRQDVLRGVRWLPADGAELEAEPVSRAITEDEIPTTPLVHALAVECAQRSGVWWRQLEVVLVAYSGLRWGEHDALTAAQIDPHRRRITVDRQIVETRSALRQSLPKGRRRRVTMYPAATPAGVDLAGLVQRRSTNLANRTP